MRIWYASHHPRVSTGTVQWNNERMRDSLLTAYLTPSLGAADERTMPGGAS